MSGDSSEKPSVNRWATGIRMATVIVVLGTLAAVWHPGVHEPATVLDGGSVTSAPAGMPDAAAAAIRLIFRRGSRRPKTSRPQAPTF